MATLHFICEKAGAGKTTMARKSGRTVPAVVFCEDEWVDSIGFQLRSFDDFWSACSALGRGRISTHVRQARSETAL